MSKEELVYVPMAADLLHIGHINILKQARKYGKVIVGLVTDEAIAEYKRVPYMKYEDRKKIVESLSNINKVIPQTTKDYIPNLRKLKPNYFIHGDDWKEGSLVNLRERVFSVMAEWGGKVIEIPYTKGISSTNVINYYSELGIMPEARMSKLKRILNVKSIARILEVHNGITGLIAEKTTVNCDGEMREFDGMWISSLTDSVAKGKPDTGAVDMSSRIHTIEQILDVTTKPIIVDADNGGFTEHFVFTIKSLERLGVSAVVIEDKVGLKRNSLFGTKVKQKQESIEKFCEKIKYGKQAQVTIDFMIIARIESLILKAGVEDALKRAKAYIKAGADAILIHSKEAKIDKLKAFCDSYSRFSEKVPLVAVPTAYNNIKEDELIDIGVKIVIYANHMLRSAYPAMKKTAETILENKRSLEASEQCTPIKEIITLIPGSK